MVVLIVLLVGVVSLAIWWVREQFSYWEKRGIPHDPPKIPVGNVAGMMRTIQVSDIFKRSYFKYKNKVDGPFVGFYMFFKRIALVVDIDFVKTVLIKDFEKFHDRGIFHNETDDPFSNNLVTIEGEKWKNLRNKLTPTFTSGKMKHMFPIFLKVGEEMVQVLNEKTSNVPQPLEITDLVSRYTVDVIGNCAFGLECNSLHNPEAEFVKMGNAVFTLKRHGRAMDLFLFGAPKLAAKLRIKVTSQKVEDFYMNIIKDTVDYRMKNNIQRNDFMDMLIDFKRKYDEGNKEDGLSFNELAAQAFVFFLGGHETSATTMGFALHELAINQDIQNRLRNEIDEVLAKNNGEFNYESMNEMKYLEKVIDETLRKHPVVGHLIRKATQRYVHPDNPKYYIEAGTGVTIPVRAIHHDPEFYPEPEKFIPERFDEEQVKQRPPCSYLPFGDGPRNCIGLRFGRMQTTIGLAKLIHNFKFEVNPTLTSVPMKFKFETILLSAEGGITLNVSKVTKK
ncbi:uncharacterized protein Dwil_GK21514 [Drosophila willistoni]|uniref:GK21514 n=1 Tax=Drosophila willistoni TaxID=7260 RepID=B4MQ11_DROWI|nr:probable cytochrome P450 6a20 [Drosophila willistoni]EDW74200.1 uncharacterized protein Dwil_GK21514 [Drosophila willistoni]